MSVCVRICVCMCVSLSKSELSFSPSLTFVFILKKKQPLKLLVLADNLQDSKMKAVERPDRPHCDFSELHYNYLWVALSPESWNIFYLLSTVDCSVKGNMGTRSFCKIFLKSKCPQRPHPLCYTCQFFLSHTCSLQR